jgi:4-diphosphocytidyl-2-C-methyl-D-erythritol kinase
MGETSGPVSEPAPAKVNPVLRVIGTRDDGYHEVETLVQPVTLADGVQAAAAPEGLELTVAGERAEDVPAGEENLVMRAARALIDATGTLSGARLLLAKRILVAAGLGGGSADAAATLRALDRLWGLGLGPDGLAPVAASIGSDVPALLPGGPVLARGRGELVEPVDLPPTWWVLVPFTFGIPAAEAFGWWDEDGDQPEETAAGPSGLLDALRSGDLTEAARRLRNDLQPGVVRRHPIVGEAIEGVLEAGALGAVVCGSGPTVAGLARDGFHAGEIASRVGGYAVGSMGRRVPAG